MKKKKTTEGKSISDKHNDYRNIAMLCLAVLAVLFVSWTFTGKWPWTSNPYNSYMLQARAWTEGRLDLGKDYPHLELAIFEGKYFVSFPPLPSFLMFPFALVHFYTADGYIAVASALAGAVYAYKLAEHFTENQEKSIFFALFLTIGSNWLFTAQTQWVWFIAQNLAFTFSLMALYYAVRGKLGLSLAFWACAVGCRPLQLLYLPVLLYLFRARYKSENPEDSISDMIKKSLTALIPMAAIALSYMILNFARFGNPLEFGHNYLPEFTRVDTGQFNIAYLKENLGKLFRLPAISFSGKWEYQSIDGTCMLLVSPICIAYIIHLVKAFINKEQKDIRLYILILAMLAAELVITCAHKTMGGSHFGNRYTNDVLPPVFLGLCMMLKPDWKYEKICLVLFAAGLTANIAGSILYYGG